MLEFEFSIQMFFNFFVAYKKQKKSSSATQKKSFH